MRFLLQRSNTIAWSCLIVLCLFAWFLQSNLLMNWDVSWDLLASKRLINGGSYTEDFFDLNPPLIFFLFVPAVFIAKLLSISTDTAFRFYIFSLALFSLGFCHYFLRSIFKKEPPLFTNLLLVSIFLIFLVFPGPSLGEREHLLIIFTFPYFLMVYQRLDNKTINPWLAFTIGIFAFMGFALKPFFLAPFITVECIYSFYTRRYLSWLRVEVITIFGLGIVYVLVTLVFYPDYLNTVVMLSKRFYYAGFSEPWRMVLFSPLTLFCGTPLLFYWTQHKNNAYKKLCMMLFSAEAGFFISYLVQQTNWQYHLFSTISMAFFLNAILFGLTIIKHRHKIVRIGILASALFSLPLINIISLHSLGLQYKKEQSEIMAFLNTHAQHKPVYFITASPREVFPAVEYSQAIYASRLLHLFWVPAIAKSNEIQSALHVSPRAQQDERTLVDMLVTDLEKFKPQYIFIDIREHKAFLYTYSFDYLPYLLKNKRFNDVFANYHYVKTIQSPHLAPRASNWSLYRVKDFNTFRPQEMNHSVIVIAGEKSPFSIYYVKDKQLISYRDKLLESKRELTKEQLTALSEEGEVAVNEKNKQVILALIDDLAWFPAYKLAVYQRQKPNEKAGL